MVKAVRTWDLRTEYEGKPRTKTMADARETVNQHRYVLMYSGKKKGMVAAEGAVVVVEGRLSDREEGGDGLHRLKSGSKVFECLDIEEGG